MTYDDLIRELYGRSPTAEETRRHLTLNRMAKDSSLDVDPITMTLIACDMRMARPSAMGIVWRWPLATAGVACAFLLMGAISFSAAVTQHGADIAHCALLSRIPPQPVLHSLWIGAVLATVATWPTLPFVLSTVGLLGLVAVLGFRRSGSKVVWPRRR